MNTTAPPRDHGGGLDAAIARYGGARSEWLDLSTGINPVPYPIGDIAAEAWTALPDSQAQNALLTAARQFWNVPEEAEIIAAPGASALIARMPALTRAASAYIPGPTYNEHAAAFHAAGLASDDPGASAHVYVHPNNPDGRLWPSDVIADRALTVIDESFCDIAPEASHIAQATRPGVVILKSFGKFWGLAGLRLGFAITQRDFTQTLTDQLGPWPVAGPALSIGTRALSDTAWATATRTRLSQDAARLDALLTAKGATLAGGTSLFRLYAVDDAAAWQDRLARAHIWSRIFPYSNRWLRLGLPAPDRWDQVARAL